jgi:Fe-S-cluster containining protein
VEKIFEIADEARENISDFCINECHSYCCRKGYLIVSPDLANLMSGEYKERLILEKTLKELIDGKFSISFENSLGSCPQLKNFKCLIHENPLRPQTCKDFPIFILGKKIKISKRCPAKKANKFFKFEHEARKLGFEFVDDFFN